MNVNLLLIGTLWAQTVDFSPRNVRVGDPDTSYANVELCADGRTLLWFEMTPGSAGNGVAWHCGINPDTGDLIPPDGKGYRAFETNVFVRPNPGLDAKGVFYVGADRSGQLYLVRPTGPTTGTRTKLGTLVDPARRAIYCARIPSRSSSFVFWIKNSDKPGGGMNPANDWFELQVIDTAKPDVVYPVERQPRPAIGFAPMDSGFARWMQGGATLTYGSFDQDGWVQVKAFDALRPHRSPVFLTSEPSNKVDPFGWSDSGTEYLVAGIDGGASGRAYVRNKNERTASTIMRTLEDVAPSGSQLESPGMFQSFEPIVMGGAHYGAFQINNVPAGSNFWETTFGQPGEIWLTTIAANPQRRWRLTETSTWRVCEPEPYVGSTRAWVFFSVSPASGQPFNGVWELYRADTPLRLAPPPAKAQRR